MIDSVPAVSPSRLSSVVLGWSLAPTFARTTIARAAHQPLEGQSAGFGWRLVHLFALTIARTTARAAMHRRQPVAVPPVLLPPTPSAHRSAGNIASSTNTIGQHCLGGLGAIAEIKWSPRATIEF